MAKKRMHGMSEHLIANADGPAESLRDYSCASTDADVTVVFRNHRAALLEFIDEHQVILGAVAWFTDEKVIRALQGKFASIILQKEDFLKPDQKGTRSSLQQAYSAVESKLTRFGIPGVANSMSYCGSPEIEAFRCVGNFNRDKRPAFPRMHNKFLVGGSIIETENGHDITPKAVWTGSYNISYNAQMSLENALVLRSKRIAEAFSLEWSQILALSEKLDWRSDWIEPEYRIGS